MFNENEKMHLGHDKCQYSKQKLIVINSSIFNDFLFILSSEWGLLC